MLTTILFDLDGTLVDTEPLAVRALRETYRSWGLSVPEKIFELVVGRTWESALRDVFLAAKPPMAHDSASRAIRDHYHRLVHEELVPLPGVLEAVESLASRFSLHIVSGSSREEIQSALDKTRLSPFFKTIVGSQDYRESKPSPEPYLTALSRLGLTPGQAVIFEDSTAGVRSGIAAGLRVIALEYDKTFNADLSQATIRLRDLVGLTADGLLKILEAKEPA